MGELSGVELAADMTAEERQRERNLLVNLIDDPTHDRHEWVSRFADLSLSWAGLPMPLDGMRLRLEDRHWAKAPFERPKSEEEDDPTFLVRNVWYSRRRRAYVYLWEKGGQLRVTVKRRNRSAERASMWLSTIDASRAWDINAELAAQEKLRDLVPPHLFNLYLLTGSLLQSSSRSGLTYMLRRARPTVVLTPLRRRDEDSPLKVLTVLCMHPIAYYEGSWAGAMVPTDEVIAHLLMIRGDEPLLWRRANQHDPEIPEAGV